MMRFREDSKGQVGTPVKLFPALGSTLLALLSLALFVGVMGQGASPPVYAALPSRAEGAPLSADQPYTNCRFGVGQVYSPVTAYPDFPELNLGWYLDWTSKSHPARPNGIEYVQMLRVNGTSYTPSGSVLATIIAENPGAMWLVGNEPDSPVQDNVVPEEYAQAYHDAYYFIKAHDPTAHVVVGNVVQPTPLRMEYLDRALSAYQAHYDEPLPADGWGVHSFILREASCEHYPNSCWGALIPPGMDAPHGELYELEEIDDLDIFETRILDFRRWMTRHGYRDTPLYVTEYGLLVPHDYEGWGPERTKVFMYGTFDFMRDASHPDYGYPKDENRLVQRWLWWSLDDYHLGGPLFDMDTGEMLPSGVDFSAYTSALSPTVDLYAASVGQASPPPLHAGGAMTVTLRAYVSNVGNQPLASPVVVRFLDAADNVIGEETIAPGLAGCAAWVTAEVEYADLGPGVHPVRVVVDPEGLVAEADEGNNEVTGWVLVPTDAVWLPLVTKLVE
jgi:hypothetical protein